MVTQRQEHCKNAGTISGTCLGLTGRLKESHCYLRLPFWVNSHEALNFTAAHWLRAGDGERLMRLFVSTFVCLKGLRRLDRHRQPHPRGERVGCSHYPQSWNALGFTPLALAVLDT